MSGDIEAEGAGPRNELQDTGGRTTSGRPSPPHASPPASGLPERRTISPVQQPSAGQPADDRHPHRHAQTLLVALLESFSARCESSTTRRVRVARPASLPRLRSISWRCLRLARRKCDYSPRNHYSGPNTGCSAKNRPHRDKSA